MLIKCKICKRNQEVGDSVIGIICDKCCEKIQWNLYQCLLKFSSVTLVLPKQTVITVIDKVEIASVDVTTDGLQIAGTIIESHEEKVNEQKR